MAAQQNSPYSELDTLLYKEAVYIQRQFSRMHKQVLTMDELHIFQTVSQTYDEMYDSSISTFEKIVDAYLSAYEYGLIHSMLTDYDKVTKYQYRNEFIRKRDRMYESILAARTDPKIYKAGQNAWARQVGQYGLEIADEAMLRKMKKNGVKRVMWCAEHDEKTCDICAGRDGKIYSIDKVPPKTHYNCRCWLRAVI